MVPEDGKTNVRHENENCFPKKIHFFCNNKEQTFHQHPCHSFTHSFIQLSVPLVHWLALIVEVRVAGNQVICFMWVILFEDFLFVRCLNYALRDLEDDNVDGNDEEDNEIETNEK